MCSFKHPNETLKLLLEQGRQLELALVFDLMPDEQVAALSPENQKYAQAAHGVFKRDYHGWYAKSLMLIRQLALEKHEEFASYYLLSPKRGSIEPITEQLKEWFEGVAPAFHQYEGEKFFNGPSIVSAFFGNQLHILEACRGCCEDNRSPDKVNLPPLFSSLVR